MDDMCLLKLDEALSDEAVHHEKISSRKKFIRCKAGVERYSLGRTKLVEIAREAVASYNKLQDAAAERDGTEPRYLPCFSCHILRHTFCTSLCEQDVNIKVIQAVMGHASVKITMDIYAEVSEEKKLSELDKLAQNWKVF